MHLKQHFVVFSTLKCFTHDTAQLLSSGVQHYSLEQTHLFQAGSSYLSGLLLALCQWGLTVHES